MRSLRWFSLLPRLVPVVLAFTLSAVAAGPSIPRPGATVQGPSNPQHQVERPSSKPETTELRGAALTTASRVQRPAAIPRGDKPALARTSAPKHDVRVGRAPKLVVYDWDGTLGDTYPNIRYIVTNAARDAGLPELPVKNGEDPYRSVIDGAGLEVMFRRLAPNGTHEQEVKFVERFKVHTANAPRDLVKLKPGIVDELRAMRDKHPDIKLAILSSRPQEVVEGFAKSAGIDSFFSKIVGTGGSKIAEKPSPEGLHAITRALGIDPKDGLMIGDTPMDVGAGKAAGMKTVALRDGMGVDRELVDAQPDHLLEHLPGLVDRVFPSPAKPSKDVFVGRRATLLHADHP